MNVTIELKEYVFSMCQQVRAQIISPTQGTLKIMGAFNDRGPWFTLKEAVSRFGKYKLNTLQKFHSSSKNKRPELAVFFRQSDERGKVEIHQDFFKR